MSTCKPTKDIHVRHHTGSKRRNIAPPVIPLFLFFPTLPAEIKTLICMFTTDAKAFYGLAVSCRQLREICFEISDKKKIMFTTLTYYREYFEQEEDGSYFYDFSEPYFCDWLIINKSTLAEGLETKPGELESCWCWVHGGFLPGGSRHGEHMFYDNSEYDEYTEPTDLKNVIARYTYRDGLLHGPAVMYYYETGILKQTGTFINGHETGIRESFYEPDTVGYESEEEGEGEDEDIDKERMTRRRAKYNPDAEKGTLFRRANIVSGLREGSLTEWFFNGVCSVEANFYADRLEGELVRYYPDGMLRTIEGFSGGRKEGKHKYYNENGSLSFTCNMMKGYRHGRCCTWSTKGTLTGDYAYHCGDAIDNNTKWNADGSPQHNPSIWTRCRICKCDTSDLYAYEFGWKPRYKPVTIDTDSESYKMATQYIKNKNIEI